MGIVYLSAVKYAESVIIIVGGITQLAHLQVML